MFRDDEERLLRRAEFYGKMTAARRNAKATLMLIQLAAFVTFITVAGVKVIETTLARFSNQIAFSVIITVAFGVTQIGYMLVHWLATRQRIGELFDTSIPKNVFFQHVVLLAIVPVFSALIVGMRWALFAQTDNDSTFDAADDNGITYTFGSLVEFVLCVICIPLVLFGFTSFTDERQDELEFVADRGVVWNPQLAGEWYVEPEYNAEEGRTELKPGPLARRLAGSS